MVVNILLTYIYMFLFELAEFAELEYIFLCFIFNHTCKCIKQMKNGPLYDAIVRVQRRLCKILFEWQSRLL